MDLTLTTAHRFSTAEELTMLFCVLWPFVARRFFFPRSSSSAPISAMVLPIALVEAAIWWTIANFLGYMPLTTKVIPWDLPALTESAWVLLWTAFWIAVMALIRKHRPVPDAGAIALSALVLAGAISIRVYVAVAELTRAFVYGAVAAALASVGIALAALVWLLLAKPQRA